MCLLQEVLLLIVVDNYFIRTLIVLLIAGIQSGQISSLLPNYSKAILSARRIFKLLDTVPQIDNYSTDGLQPVSQPLMLVVIKFAILILPYILLFALTYRTWWHKSFKIFNVYSSKIFSILNCA